jgi:hypothetical protein
MNDSIQPSAEPGATRLAIAYDILLKCRVEMKDPKSVARLLAYVIAIMLKAEHQKL